MTAGTSQVEINSELLAEAKQMDIDAANVAERALIREIKSRRDQVAGDKAARAWQAQNAEAIDWSNKRFEEHGFPFPQYRRY